MTILYIQKLNVYTFRTEINKIAFSTFHGMRRLIHSRTVILEKIATTPVISPKAVPLSYKIIGEASSYPPKPPIFIYHDILSNKSQWEAIAKTIVNMTQRLVVSVDLRNHGVSPHSNSHKYTDQAQDIIALFDKLDVRQASLIGHSMGGRAAMCVALMAPEKVAGLLVVDISPISSSEQYEHMPKVLSAMKAINFGKTRTLCIGIKEARKQLKASTDDKTFMNDIISNIRQKTDGSLGWACNLDALMKEHQHWVAFPASLKSKQYDGPTLFIGGQHSDYLPPDDLIQIRDLFPRAVITYVPKTGHFVHVDDPRTFLELTISFIRTNSFTDTVMK